MQLLGFVNRLYNKKISSKGLGVFRICFALNLFFEVNRIFRYRQLYFDPMPYIKGASFDFTIPLLVWMFVLLMIVFGAFTRIMTIANYLFIFWIINRMGVYEYHMDYTYLGVGFFMMLIPLSKSYSLDSLFKKVKYSNTKFIYKPNKDVPTLYYYSIIFVGISLVYFGSIFFKLNSVAWINGLGIWLPASIPQVTILNDQWLLNQEYFIKFIGYFALFFELVFSFVFFVKKMRPFLFLMGVIMHIGILLEFPIPYFALGYIAIYLLMLPTSLWGKLENRIKFKEPKLHFFYDAECLLCVRTKVVISHFDLFNAIEFKIVQRDASKAIELNDVSQNALLNDIYSIDVKQNVFSGVDTYKKVSQLVPAFYPIAILFFIPGVAFVAKKIYKRIVENRKTERCTEESCGITYNLNNKEASKFFKYYVLGCKFFFIALVFMQVLTVPFEKKLRALAKEYEVSAKLIKTSFMIKRITNHYSNILFGITGHGVFVDGHYKGFDKIFCLKYNGEILPMYDENGMPDDYLVGGIWANYNFRVNRPRVLEYKKGLELGLARFSAFWAHKNDVNIKDAEFTIVMKRVKVNFEWEKDLLKNNLVTPWEEVGTLLWKDSKASFSLVEIK